MAGAVQLISKNRCGQGAEDLAAYLAQPVKGRKPVNEVSGPVLYGIPFFDHTIEALHVCLPSRAHTNYVVAQMTEENLTLESVDRAAILVNSARQAELAQLEEIALGACVELSVGCLGRQCLRTEKHSTVAFFGSRPSPGLLKMQKWAKDENGLQDWSPLEVAASKR